MAEVVLDANVNVALLYAADSQHKRAVELTNRLEAEGHDVVLVDFLVFEALSVLCRRASATQDRPMRKAPPPSASNDSKRPRYQPKSCLQALVGQ